MNMYFENRTPHEVHMYGIEGRYRTFCPQFPTPRVSVTSKLIDTINGIDIVQSQYGEVIDLPPALPDTIYIVSRLVITACPDRTDLVCPDDLVRDDAGAIIGCRRFAR